MKKSMLSVVNLAISIINLALTVDLTFSLVTTNNKTNNLISKVAEIIDLDVAGDTSSTASGSGAVSVDDLEYVSVKNGDDDKITVSYTSGGKTHYVVLKVNIGLNKKAKDYEVKSASINNGMSSIVSTVTTEALKYSYDSVTSNKTNIEASILKSLQDQFQTQAIYTVTLSQILVQ